MGLLDIFLHNKIKGPQFINSGKIDQRVEILKDLLDKVGDDQKNLVEDELKLISIGNQGEDNVIYELKHSKENMLIIHDVTIEDEVKDSQIDFILITNRGIIVLETKKLSGDIEINNEGEFVRLFKNAQGKVYKKEGIYSPITQNKYHIDALSKLLKDAKLIKNFPFYSLVVIANPKTIVNKTYAKLEIKNHIVKYDQLNNAITKLLSGSTYDMSDSSMIQIGNYILDKDTPRQYDYVKKLKLILKEDKEEIVESIDVIEDEKIAKEHNDDSLYEELRKYRFNKAKEQDIKPYFIFNNEQLSALCLKRPSNKEEFIKIDGMGEKKYEIYGKDIIDIINKDKVLSEKTVSEETNIEEVKSTPSSIEDNPLYGKLRKFRFEKAQQLNVKPYIIFNNEQLSDLLTKMPKSIDELMKVNGFGEAKCKSFGEEILKIINK